VNASSRSLKSINTGDILKVVMTEEKFAKSERYKMNVKHFHPKKLLTCLSILTAV